MRISYIASFAVAGAIVSQSSSALATSAADFAGNYDIHYNSVSAQLNVDVKGPKGGEYPFGLNFDLMLDPNEQVPYSAVDPIIETAKQVLLEQYPDMPASLQEKVIDAFTTALYQAVDEINAQSAALPDDMVVSTYLNSNPAPAALTMVDMDAGTQVMLPATLSITSAVANLWASDSIVASIDSGTGYKGEGTAAANDIDQTVTQKGVTVNVTGNVACRFSLMRQ